LSAGRRETTTDEQLAELAPLLDPVRRALYLYVAAQAAEVGRDEAAAAVGVTRRLAAFHLDKLVDAGFLEPSFRRLGPRSGPGSGRPSKLYKATTSERQVSLPPRDYELLAELLAQAMQAGEAASGRDFLPKVARRHGRDVGAHVLAGLGRRASRKRRTVALSDALGRLGYQPYAQGDELRLRNCPFHLLAQRHQDLVCGMNLCLLQGVMEGMEMQDVGVRLEVGSADCCVVIETVPDR
jgi:predicted ArsR family transcriptional regulator